MLREQNEVSNAPYFCPGGIGSVLAPRALSHR